MTRLDAASLTRGASLWLKRLPWIVLPPACRACGTLLEPLSARTVGFPYLCNPCHDALPWRESPMAAEGSTALDQVWAPWHYAPPVREWIWQYKYQRRDGWARCFGALAALALSGGLPLHEFTHIAPVPLHRRRFHWRGFNQALLLAHHWRRQLRETHRGAPPIVPGLLRRTRHTQPQMELGAEDRQSNVAGAFAVHPAELDRMDGARVLLVDDVMTTGATLNECAAVLKQAGAAGVEALVIARA
jgi:ComF family protein